MSNNQVKSVFGIVLNRERTSILLIKRRDVPVWVLPGGGIDSDETAEEAVIRELFEETNLSTTIARKIGTYFPPKGGLFFKPTILFECKAENLNLSTSGETKQVAFFPVNMLPKAMPPPFPEFISDTLKNLPPFEKTITTVTLWNIFINFSLHPILAFRFILSRLGLHFNT